MRSVPSRLVRAVVQPRGCWLEHEVDLDGAEPGRQWVQVTGLGRVEASTLRLEGDGVRIHDLLVERWVEPPRPARRPVEGPDRSAIDAEMRFLDRLELPKPPGPQRMAPPARAARWLESLQARRNELQRRLRELDEAEPRPTPAESETVLHESTLRLDLEVQPGAGPLRIRHPGGWATWRPKLSAEWVGPREVDVRLDADVWDESSADLSSVEIVLQTTEDAGRPLLARPGTVESDAEGPPHPFDIASDHPDADRLVHPGPLQAFGHRPLSFSARSRGGHPATARLRSWRLPVRPVAMVRPFASPIAWLAAELHRPPPELPEAPIRLIGPDGTVRDRWRALPQPDDGPERWMLGPLPEVTCERSVTLDPSGTGIEVRLLLRSNTDMSAEFELEDQIPVSVDPQVQVKLLDWDPIDPLVDERSGRIRFDGRLTPGGTQRFRFAYRLTAPRGHRVIMVPGGEA